MKGMNNRGFTLVELLTVIVVVALVLGIGAYGVINLVDSSKNKASLISESGIKDAAELYANEASNTSWVYPQSGDYEYYCVTIDELINKGLIAKKAILPEGIEKSDYVTIKRNRVTFVKNEAIVLSGNVDTSSTEYSVCTGNVIREEITTIPLLGDSTSYTDEIDISFSDVEAESAIVSKECYYNHNDSYIPMLDNKGIIENNTCTLSELVKSQSESDYIYYVKICMSTENGSVLCSKPSSYTTAEFVKPVISYVNNSIKIDYDDTDVKVPYHYFKSNEDGSSNINVSLCDDNFVCSGSTTDIEKDKWYKVDKNSVIISYDKDVPNGKIYARTYDDTGNYGESSKEFALYRVTFFKGDADSIDNSTSDVIKYCIVDKGKSCQMTSPSIKKVGYKIIGWNTVKEALGSAWDVGTSKNIKASFDYYPIISDNKYIVNLDDQGATTKGSEAVSVKYGEAMPSIELPKREYTVTLNYNGLDKDDEVITSTYTFLGYYDDKDGAGTKYYSDTGVSARNWDKTVDESTLYADWKSQGMKLPNVERDYYTFKGWYKNKNCEAQDKAGDAGVSYTPSTNTVLYACWEKNKVFIKYNPNGGTLNEGNGFTIGDNGNILKNGKENIQELGFDEPLGENGLYNYNNSSYINITKSGYTAMKGNEWECLSDNCKATYYSQDIEYNALDICETKDGDCTVTLGVNWIETNKTYKYIDYYLFNLMKNEDEIINGGSDDGGYTNSSNFRQIGGTLVEDESGRVCLGEENEDDGNCKETWELDDFYNNYKAIRNSESSKRFIVPNGGKASVPDSYFEEYVFNEQEQDDVIVVTSYHISEVWYRKVNGRIESGRGYDYSNISNSDLINASVIPTGSGTINGTNISVDNGTDIKIGTIYPYGNEELPSMLKFTVNRIIIRSDLNNTPVNIDGTEYYFAPAVYKVVSTEKY